MLISLTSARDKTPPALEHTHVRRRGPRPRRRDSASRKLTRRSARVDDASERDVVVHVGVARACSSHTTRWRARGTAGTEVAATGLIGKATAATAAAAFEHGEGRVEPLQHDLGRVFLYAALIGPFAGLQLALDVDL